MTTAARDRRYCSRVTRELGIDPIGNASFVSQFLFVEVPPPWAFRVHESRHFPAGLLNAVDVEDVRGAYVEVLAIQPEVELVQPGRRRLIHYRRPGAFFSHFQRAEFVVPEEQVVDLARALVQAPDAAGCEPLRVPGSGARDLFVCTHGTRDICCAAFGAPLYRAIRDGQRHNGVRAWRTSHFGEHKLAPTIVDLPEGRYWGFVDRQILDVLLRHDRPVAALREHYRGWAGLASFEQMAERELFIQHGWPWTERPKLGRTLATAPDRSHATVEIAAADPEAAWIAEIEQIESVHTLGSCDEDAVTFEQYRVAALTRVR